jgi:hypothetical protein
MLNSLLELSNKTLYAVATFDPMYQPVSRQTNTLFWMQHRPDRAATTMSSDKTVRYGYKIIAYGYKLVAYGHKTMVHRYKIVVYAYKIVVYDYKIVAYRFKTLVYRHKMIVYAVRKIFRRHFRRTGRARSTCNL